MFFVKLQENIINKIAFVYRWFIQTNKVSQHKIKISQESLLKKNYDKSIEKLIIFLTPGNNWVDGGIMSISSIYEETKKLKEIHNAEVILCTIPDDPLLLKYTKFKNQNYIYEFSQVLSYFKNLKNLMIHIPEYSCEIFFTSTSHEDYKNLYKIENLHINILIQNIEIALRNQDSFKKITEKFTNITGTTAHEKYSSQEMRNKFGFPLHKLSVFVSPEQYKKKAYQEKEDLIIISPDKHPRKSEVLKRIRKEFPKMKVQIIHGLKYGEFKDVISRAKWALTFGEGLDGYFVETIFSGGISFSVYNKQFFSKDFKALKTVYSSYDELLKKLPSNIIDLNNDKCFTQYQYEQYELCCNYYNYEEYRKNLELFYKCDYTYK